MKAVLAFALASCLLAVAFAEMEPCIEQSECEEGVTCCVGAPFIGAMCKNFTKEGEKCPVTPKTIPMFGDFIIGKHAPCEEGLVCVQEGKKKRDGVCQVPPTTAAPTEAVVDEASDSGSSDDAASAESAGSDSAPAESAEAEAAPAEAAEAEAAPAEAATAETAPAEE